MLLLENIWDLLTMNTAHSPSWARQEEVTELCQRLPLLLPIIDPLYHLDIMVEAEAAHPGFPGADLLSTIISLKLCARFLPPLPPVPVFPSAPHPLKLQDCSRFHLAQFYQS